MMSKIFLCNYKKIFELFALFISVFNYSQIYVSDHTSLYIADETLAVVTIDSLSLKCTDKVKIYTSSSALVLNHSEEFEVIGLHEINKQKTRLGRLQPSTRKEVIHDPKKSKPAQEHENGSAEIRNIASSVAYLSIVASNEISIFSTHKTNPTHSLIKDSKFLIYFHSNHILCRISALKGKEFRTHFSDYFAGRAPPVTS